MILLFKVYLILCRVRLYSIYRFCNLYYYISVMTFIKQYISYDAKECMRVRYEIATRGMKLHIFIF